jgi:hypothetical protein
LKATVLGSFYERKNVRPLWLLRWALYHPCFWLKSVFTFLC